MAVLKMQDKVDALYDSEQLMKDAGLVAASAAATVSASAKTLDVGEVRYVGNLIVDTTAVEIASNDEVYKIEMQGSNDSFSTYVVLASLELGANEVLGGTEDSAAAARYELPFVNQQPAGTAYSQLRVYTRVAGTVATGINYKAFIAPLK